MNEKKEVLVELVGVKKSFKKGVLGAKNHKDLVVIDDLNLKLRSGEIVALLGKSGCGKSTLLRMIGGLIEPTAGEIYYRQQKVTGPVPGVAIVFQNFALLPWLTVLKNVELGLEAQMVPKEERLKRAIKTIDIVGLDGFEIAYPRELSGGMKQRVGLARALAINPEMLLMDEPFSALDVLTAENLRGDLLDLWRSKETNLKSILIVTHNIEEAAILADRIIVIGSAPQNIRADIEVDLGEDRVDTDPKFRELVDHIYSIMTLREEGLGFGKGTKIIGIGYKLPDVDISEITGFLEQLNDPVYSNKKVDLPEFADEFSMNVDDMFPIIEILEILRFVKVSKGDIELTEAGRCFAQADIFEGKKIFAAHLLSYVPLARYIRRVLDDSDEHTVHESEILAGLDSYMNKETAEAVLKTVIDWGRYAEIFAYNANDGELSLEDI